jgi:GNAT superfamily N-acetyltransferase
MDFFKDYDCFLEYYAYDYDLTQPIDKNKIEVMKKGIVRSGEYSLEELDGMNQERIAELTCVHFYEAEDYSAEKIYLKTKKQIDEATDSLFKVMSNSYPEDWEEDLMPPKKEEWRDIILEMKKVVTPDLAMFVKYKGEPVGVIAVIPDLTQGIQRAKGKLFPFGWYHLLKSQKETKKARGIILFVDERHQKRGIPGYMILKMRKNLLEAGFKKIEISSISSMNKDSNGIYQWLDMDIVKKYRLFGKSVDGSRLSVEEMYGIASEKVKKYRKTG